MFRRPMKVALQLFDLWYSTFCLCSWVTNANESSCRDQYTQLLDDLRVFYGPNFDVTSTSLIGLDFLQSHERLPYVFRLCGLCAATPSPTYPDVTVGSFTTSGHQSRFTDVILPCQSYRAGVSGSVTFCSGDSNLEKFSILTASFGQTDFSPTYDPWTYVDNFGRSNIYKSLSSSCRAVLAGPKMDPVRSETEGSVVDKSALKPLATVNEGEWKTVFPGLPLPPWLENLHQALLILKCTYVYVYTFKLQFLLISLLFSHVCIYTFFLLLSSQTCIYLFKGVFA